MIFLSSHPRKRLSAHFESLKGVEAPSSASYKTVTYMYIFL